MIRVHYADLFANDPAWAARAAALAAKTRELTDFLVDVLHVDRVPGTYRGQVTYHDSCSGLREMGVKTQPRALLARLPGIKLVEMAECETCCGFGGTFAIKNADVSLAMLDDKLRSVRATGAQVCAAADCSCLMHIGGGLRRAGDGVRTLHLAEILAS